MAQSTLQFPTAVAAPRVQIRPLLRKLSIIGALAFYLDFLTLFYYLLRLLGRSR